MNDWLKRVKEKRVWLPAIILIVGAFLRFYGLESQSLWNDELSSWRMTRYDSFGEVLEKGVKTDGHPPGFHLVLWGIQKIAGDSPTALRFPSALAGALAVWLMFLLGTALFNRRGGIWSSALMAVAWCPVYFSQEARSYSLLLMFSILAYLLTWQIGRGSAKNGQVGWKLWLGEAVVLAILCYLHYFGAILAFLLVVWLLLLSFRREAFKKVVALAGVVLLSYLPWLIQIPDQMQSGPKWIEPAGALFFGYFLGFIFNKSGLVLGAAVLLMAAAAWNGVKGLKTVFRKEEPSAELYLLFLLLGPYLAGWLVSALLQPVLSWRNLIISLPAAYLLVTRGWELLPVPEKGKGKIWWGLMLALLLHLLLGIKYYHSPQKEQFREAAEFILKNENLAPDAPLYGYAWYPEYLEYYFRQAGQNQSVKMLVGDENQFKALQWAVEADSAAFFWYFWGHRRPEAHFIHLLHMNYEIVGYQQFNGAGVYLFRKIEKRGQGKQ
ncbi:MAG: hypothetical protein Kow0037_29400 [Calditrichia bacterium]